MSAGVWLKRGGAPGWEAARTQGREGGGLSLTVDRKASVAHPPRMLFRQCENHQCGVRKMTKCVGHVGIFRKKFLLPTIRSITPCDDSSTREEGEKRLRERCRLGGNSFLFSIIKEKSNWEI